MIKLSDEDPPCMTPLGDSRRAGASRLVRNSGRYPSAAEVMSIPTHFCRNQGNADFAAGRVGTIVPSGIATDDTTKYFFQDLSEKHSLPASMILRTGDFPGRR